MSFQRHSQSDSTETQCRDVHLYCPLCNVFTFGIEHLSHEWPLICIAARLGDVEMCKELLNEGAEQVPTDDRSCLASDSQETGLSFTNNIETRALTTFSFANHTQAGDSDSSSDHDTPGFSSFNPSNIRQTLPDTISGFGHGTQAADDSSFTFGNNRQVGSSGSTSARAKLDARWRCRGRSACVSVDPGASNRARAITTFSFGNSPQGTDKPGFTFGNGRQTGTTASVDPGASNRARATTTFAFGNSPQGTNNPGFTFGNGRQTGTTANVDPGASNRARATSTFSFGNSSQGTNKPGFTFGNGRQTGTSNTAPSPKASGGALNFSTTNETVWPNVRKPSGGGGFHFGGTDGAASTESTKPSSSGAFNFGGTGGAASTESTKPSSSGAFNFGGTGEKASAGSFGISGATSGTNDGFYVGASSCQGSTVSSLSSMGSGASSSQFRLRNTNASDFMFGNNTQANPSTSALSSASTTISFGEPLHSEESGNAVLHLQGKELRFRLQNTNASDFMFGSNTHANCGTSALSAASTTFSFGEPLPLRSEETVHDLLHAKETPLFFASRYGHYDVCQLLLENGATHDGNVTGDTPLHVAASHGHYNVCKLLLENGANHTGNNTGDTPLHHAVRYGFYRLCKLLLENGAPQYANNSAMTPLRVASKWGDYRICILLMQHGANRRDFVPNARSGSTRDTMLHLAAAQGHLDECRFLLKNGATHDGNRTGESPLFVASRQGQYDVCKLLLDNGAVHDGDENGDTPLHVASEQGYYDVCKLLLEKGARHVANNAGSTPLHVASMARHIEIMQLLTGVVDRDDITNNYRLPLSDANAYCGGLSTGHIRSLFRFDGFGASLERAASRESNTGTNTTIPRFTFGRASDEVLNPRFCSCDTENFNRDVAQDLRSMSRDDSTFDFRLKNPFTVRKSKIGYTFGPSFQIVYRCKACRRKLKESASV